MAKGKGKKSGKPKLPSLANSVTLVGGAVAVTGIGATAADKLVGGLNDMAKMAGVGAAVTGVGVIALINGLKAAASFSKWFGRKYRAYLRGYGFRP